MTKLMLACCYFSKISQVSGQEEIKACSLYGGRNEPLLAVAGFGAWLSIHFQAFALCST